MKPLEYFLKPTQKQLFRILLKMYQSRTVSSIGKFLLVKGEAPVLIVSHLDTVHKEPVQTICTSQKGNILMSPQGIGGDDRCGVYALVNAHDASEKKPWLLFTCDEEIGCIGARAFAEEYEKGHLPNELTDVKLIIEIDRRGSMDAVYYDCGNEDFEDYISSKGFKTEIGSFSDISIIAPVMGVAGVNLSSGYYNAHTLHEYINRRQIDSTMHKVIEIIDDAAKPDFPRFEYIENIWQDEYGYGVYLGFPRDLPEEYIAIYDELLDYYSEKELERYRKANGNENLFSLYHAMMTMK